MSSDHISPQEESDYVIFGGRQRRDKAMSTLIGILEGINADGVINSAECSELDQWLILNGSLLSKPPYSTLLDAARKAIEDRMLSEEERLDLIWLAGEARSDSAYFDELTRRLETLCGLLHGILADGKVTEAELDGLSTWQEENAWLRGNYPFDEIDSAVTRVMRDRVVDANEQRALVAFFNQFCNATRLDQAAARPEEVKAAYRDLEIASVFAVDPGIEFASRSFCFTGQSSKGTRNELWDHVRTRGGFPTNSITVDLHYLVVGHIGSACWAHTTFGRKIQTVLIERKRRSRKTLIVREPDFWDAVADHPAT